MADSRLGTTHLVGDQLIYDSSSWYNCYTLGMTFMSASLERRDNTEITSLPYDNLIQITTACIKLYQLFFTNKILIINSIIYNYSQYTLNLT
jgi:hypothetical protein